MMKITAEKSKFHRFYLTFDYDPFVVDFCRQLKESFGWNKFSFSAENGKKGWAFSDSLLVPVILEKFPETEIESAVKILVEQEQKWTQKQETMATEIDRIRVKEDTDFDVKGLKMKLYNYQRVGVEFFVASGGRAINADAMGVGKTCQAIAFAKHSGFKRTLVVCPASVKFSWRLEIRKWTNMSYVIVDSKTDIPSIPADVEFWIINYDILRKHFSQLSKIRFDCAISDESQYLKSPQAIRTKTFRELSRYIPSVLLLSGTPLLNRTAELFSLLNIVDPKTWDNWYDYARRYCALKRTRWGMDSSGVSNVDELHERIRRYFIRRDKSQVLKELPPKTFIETPVELTGHYKKEYDAVASDLATYLRQRMGLNLPAVKKAMTAEKLVQLNLLRQLCAMGKLGAAKELIESIIDSGEKVLVFSSFVEPLLALKEYFKDKAVIITGQTPVAERGEAVKLFQEKKAVQVFLGSYRAAGVGITLTAAQNFVGIDYPWTNADLFQSHDRLHRPGQTAQNVNIYQIFAENTIDEDMKDVLDLKQDIFEQVIEGKQKKEATETIMTNAVERVLNNY